MVDMRDARKIDAEVAERVRVELTRQRRTAASLARAVGMEPRLFRYRTRAEVGFTVVEILRVADALDVPVGTLLGGEK